MAGFFKKLIAGANKAVGALAGIGAKILPAPIGTAAKLVQGASAFTAKLVEPKKTAKATASVGNVAAAASASTMSMPPITIGEKKSWFMENIAWVIPTGLAFLAGLIFLLIPKRKR